MPGIKASYLVTSCLSQDKPEVFGQTENRVSEARFNSIVLASFGEVNGADAPRLSFESPGLVDDLFFVTVDTSFK